MQAQEERVCALESKKALRESREEELGALATAHEALISQVLLLSPPVPLPSSAGTS